MRTQRNRTDRGSTILMGALLAVVVAALSVTLLSSTIAHQRAVAATNATVGAREAAEMALAMRLVELQNGDLLTQTRNYAFADGSSAQAVLHIYTPTRVGLEVTARNGASQTRLLATLVGGGTALQPSVSGGNLFIANDIKMENNNEAPQPFDSREGLPSESNSTGQTIVFANETIFMTNQSVVHGKVLAGQSIRLENNSQVSDSVRAPSVTIVNHAGAGTVEQSAVPTITMPSYDALIDEKFAEYSAVAVDKGDVRIRNNKTYTIEANQVVRYGFFDTGNQGDLIINGPTTVIFDRLLVNNNSQLIINGEVNLLFGTGGVNFRNQSEFIFPDRGDGFADASVRIYSKGPQIWENNGNIGAVPPKPSEFQVYMYSNNLLFEFRNQSYFYGAILNPGGQVLFRNNTDLKGFVMADYALLGNQTDAQYDIALDAEFVEENGDGGEAEGPSEWTVESVTDASL